MPNHLSFIINTDECSCVTLGECTSYGVASQLSEQEAWLAGVALFLVVVVAVTKYLIYVKPFKEEGFILAHSSRLGSVVVGKARQQEHKATSHMATAVRKQRDVNDGALLLLSLDFSLGPEPRGCCHPSLLWIFTPRLTKSTNSHTGVPRDSLPRRFTILSRWHPYKPLES